MAFQIQRCLFFILLWSSFLLNGCVDLAPTKSLYKTNTHLFKAPAQAFVMRGGLGGIFSTGMNQLQYTLEHQYHIKTESTPWYKAHSLSQQIIAERQKKPSKEPIILIGHSLGANEQIKVAKKLQQAHIPVALLITVDAVAPMHVPDNVAIAINIYKPGIVPLFSGLQLIADNPHLTIINNINVATIHHMTVNHFTIDKNAEIQNLMIRYILTAIHPVAANNKRSHGK